MESRTPVTKIAYQTFQQGKSIAGLVHKELSTKIMSLVIPNSTPGTEPISREILLSLQDSINKLQKLDWDEAEKGIYPKTQLFDYPLLEWAAIYPLIWLDLPATWKRRKNKQTRDIPKNINTEIYPDYYLQNFHHQTDGYLSEHSAGLYDLQVEILFNGTADLMRRRILAPLKNGLMNFKDRPKGSIRILDVATGTGRALKQIRSSFPEAELIGLDLSEAYLKQASRYINNHKKDLAQLIRGNAESMPFANESMQAMSCVFLFHELPRSARQNVLKECWRILEPGGVLVLADSIQLNDSPQFSKVLEDFHKVFHEPYYRDYLIDDIEQRMSDEGFVNIEGSSHFMTRVWKASKPF